MGGKHLSTMIRALVDAGRDETYLKTLPRDSVKRQYEDLEAGAIVPKPKVVVAPQPPPKPLSRINQDDAKPVYEACILGFVKLKDHYDLDNECEVPERITDYALKIYFAHTLAEAHDIAKKAHDKFFIHLMWLVSEGKITGDANQRYSEKQAVKAENLAKYLESKGQIENAVKQRARAADIRAKMAEFKAKTQAA